MPSFSVDDFLPADVPNETPNLPMHEAPQSDAPTPTPEQQAIVTAFTSTNDNLLISALAGAAKTTTLVLLANAKPSVAMLSLAFNKRIAVEMQKRLPSTCVAKTLNALGHSAWAKRINKRFLNVDDKKTYRLVRAIIDEIKDKDEKSQAFSKMAEIMRNVDFGKSAGYIPNAYHTAANMRPLMQDEEFFAHLDEEPENWEKEIIIEASVRSLKEAWEGIIDFSDQLLMPTVFDASFVQYPITLVDEAQDLSQLNHAMLHKIVGKKRIIAVGDECQSIYGFRGAHENSMRLLQQEFDMKEYILSISFRCPIAVVEAARWRAPHMQFPTWAKPGVVKSLALWTEEDVPENAVILCRNNAPLFSMAIRLIKSKRYPELVGNDIGKALLKTLRSLGSESMNQEETIASIETWRKTKMAKARNKDKVTDQAACLRIFAVQGRTLGEAIAYCESLLSRAGPIKLMTGHKSKGLEFDNVFFLDEDLIGEDQQDRNLKYVIQTRAKETLTYVRSEAFDYPEVEGQ